MEIRRKSLVVLLGIGIAGVIGASAASLNLTSDSVGADVEVIAACDTNGTLNASYTSAYNTTDQEYMVSAVVLTDVDAACDGDAGEITLTETDAVTGDPVVLTTQAFTAATGTTTITLATPVSAEALTGIAILIAD